MRKCIYILILNQIIFSCGYPDVDNVPEFNNIYLTDDEILDYCSNIHLKKNDIDKCINDYKSKN